MRFCGFPLKDLVQVAEVEQMRRVEKELPGENRTEEQRF